MKKVLRPLHWVLSAQWRMFWSQTNVNCIFLGKATVNHVAMETVGVWWSMNTTLNFWVILSYVPLRAAVIIISFELAITVQDCTVEVALKIPQNWFQWSSCCEVLGAKHQKNTMSRVKLLVTFWANIILMFAVLNMIWWYILNISHHHETIPPSDPSAHCCLDDQPASYLMCASVVVL